MGVMWTEDQKKVIDLRNRNILVSAAAGSGKTAVLVERIMELVCDEKNEEASMYIHKLAGIYRYMIKSEDYELVPLREEMEFVGQYIDLLKLRFPEGFDVIIDVPQEQMARFVLPCSVQLLIENATKHNAVSIDNPLVIKIKAEADKICVSNNLVPKITVSSSTGLGQKYISQQYQDLSGKSIDIRKTEDEYFVTLPLL